MCKILNSVFFLLLHVQSEQPLQLINSQENNRPPTPPPKKPPMKAPV